MISDQEKELLTNLNLSFYKFNDDNNLIDFFQKIDLSNKKYKNIPEIRFGTINGSFIITNNKLTTLLNSPVLINGDFNCSSNKLTSLEFCPKEINGDFYCENNLLSSIEDYPLCIIKGNITDCYNFPKVLNTVLSNINKFEKLLNNKIEFHQLVMSLNPSLIQYYTTIQPKN